MRKPAYVYKHLNAKGEVLYIGCTQNMDARLMQHVGTSPWWPEVTRFTELGPFPRDVAQRLEHLLISHYDPPNNIFYTERHKPGRIAA
jgi:excinuclease UvrABC nuclease subunit